MPDSAERQPPTLVGPVGLLALLRFTAELGMLTALGYAGWRLVDPVPPSVVLAVGLPLLAAMVWGRWVAPQAGHRLTDPARLGVEVALFGTTFVLLAEAGPAPLSVTLGLGLLAAYVVSLPHRRRETGPGR